MKNRYFSIFILLLIASHNLFAQANLLNAKVPQEIGIPNEQQLKADDNTPIEYGFIEDRDVLWSKTIWETIDLDERVNFPYYYPTIDNGYLSSNRQSMWRILIDNIRSGEIKEVYNDDYFNTKYTFDDLTNSLFVKQLSEEGINKQNSGGIVSPDDYDEFKIESDKIVQYRIKGTWYFNKRLGELRYRLLGIAPVSPDVSVLRDKDAMSDPNNLVELFWIWYPDARKVLNENKVFNIKNSSQPVSFDNMLNSRRFNATIYKEENVFEDRKVKDYIYEDALRQLLESERIKSVIRDFEQDQWNN
jgi:gliding motility associated protien GldN